MPSPAKTSEKGSLFSIKIETTEDKKLAQFIFKERPGLNNILCTSFDVKYDNYQHGQVYLHGDRTGQKGFRLAFHKLSELHKGGARTIGKQTVKDVVSEIKSSLMKSDFDTNAANQNKPQHTTSFTPRNDEQEAHVASLRTNLMTIGEGPAGTGKTRATCAIALEKLENKDVQRIVLCRPAKSNGKAGDAALPGDEHAKLHPYLRPLYAELAELLGGGDDIVQIASGKKLLKKMIEDEIIEIAPLETIRGRTIKHAFLILDEAQNATAEQMKMFTTRAGTGTVMGVTGCNDQCDLADKDLNGLADIMSRMEKPVPGMAVIRLTKVERGPLAKTINDIYNGDYANRKAVAPRQVARPTNRFRRKLVPKR